MYQAHHRCLFVGLAMTIFLSCGAARRQREEDPTAAGRRAVNLPAREQEKRQAATDGDPRRFDDAEHWAQVFEDPQRDAWQKPEAVLRALELPVGAVVADIGSATGYFSVRFAQTPGVAMVYGADIEPELVRFLNERAQREGLSNLASVLSRIDAPPAFALPLDVAFICNTYHHLSDRPLYLARLHKLLKPQGRLAIVDWMPGTLPQGPPAAEKIDPQTAQNEVEAAGYKMLVRDEKLLPYQYLLIFENQTPKNPDPKLN